MVRKSPDRLTVAAGIVSQLARYLSSRKLDVRPLLLAQGLDPEVLGMPDARVAYEAYLAVEEEAAALSGDPFFGLHMGEWVEPGHYSIIGYLMMNSATLGEAFGIAGRYFKLLGNAITSRALPGLKAMRIVYEAPRESTVVSRHCFENLSSSCVTMMRTLTGQDLHPLEVGFRHSAGPALSEYRRVFSCPVRFGARQNYLLLPWCLAKVPVLQSNPSLLAHFERYALERSEEESPTSRQVADFVVSRLGKRPPTLAAAASSMGLSARSLQNRLREEMTGFREIVEATRLDLARRHLAGEAPVEEVALLLGYSETSAFSKAFKRLDGRSPSEFRRGSSAPG